MNYIDKRIYIAGSGGMVGNSIQRELQRKGYHDLITRTSTELDLTDQRSVDDFFSSENPEIVIIAAARVGGIMANDTYRAEFLYENLMIEANVINCAYEHNVEKLIFLGSSCIYPKFAEQPMKEEFLLTGALEPTNEPYAIAKIAGIKLCENYFRQYGCNFISVMPTNLYGPNDNFDLQTSHVIPGLIHRLHSAKIAGVDEVVVWGSGKPLREFLYVDDLSKAIVFLLETLDAREMFGDGISHINIGSGTEIEIGELVKLIKDIIGFEGTIRFDPGKPDGTPRKFLDSSRLSKIGWQAQTSLEDGLRLTYEWFLRSEAEHTHTEF